ncbi:MAG: hypothetical protein M3159_00395, partial [Actinomycetota bacterium]|nr:hypothetical protein [Actinomycetota bacterium]
MKESPVTTATNPIEDEPIDLQSRLEAVEDSAPDPPITDPASFFRQLEGTRRFHRDTGFGRILHPGSVSFRENARTDSLHVVIRGNHVAAHVDGVSPIGSRAEDTIRYSLRWVAAHNVAGLAHDLVLLLRGRQGDHRCRLDCEWMWDPAHSEPRAEDLLDPTTSAWSVQLEVRVAGSLDDGRLRAAMAETMGRHPSTHDPLDVVDCADDTDLAATRAELQRQPAQVDAWPPLKARLVHHPDGDVVMLNMNHAATDGTGALEVLQAIARSYSGKAHGDPPPDFLSVRDIPVRPASSPVSSTLARYHSVVEWLRNKLARPALLAPDGATDDPGYGFHLLSFPAENTREMLDEDPSGTNRRVILAALHLAVGEWNLKHGTPGRRVGVLVPVNLRPPEWRAETVGNFAVTARVSTGRRHRSGPAAALKEISAQSTRNKRTRTGTALLSGLGRAGLLPLWVKQSLVVLQPLTRNRQVDTAMLANLGWIDEPVSFGPDGGETREMWFSIPARTPECLCVGAVTVGGRLHLVVRYPYRLFDADAARRFADCYA